MKRDLVLAYVCIALSAVCFASACATAPAPPPAVQTSCLPLKAYTDAEQNAVADEIAKLPPVDPLVGFVADYGAMRAADRACMGLR